MIYCYNHNVLYLDASPQRFMLTTSNLKNEDYQKHSLEGRGCPCRLGAATLLLPLQYLRVFVRQICGLELNLKNAAIARYLYQIRLVTKFFPSLLEAGFVCVAAPGCLLGAACAYRR